MASDREFERGQQVGPGAVDEALEPAGRDLGKLEDPFIAAGLQLDWSRRLRGRERRRGRTSVWRTSIWRNLQRPGCWLREPAAE